MKKNHKHGGRRKGAGRHSQFSNRISIRLTTDHIAIAKKLGTGDVSAGIRSALDLVAELPSPFSGSSHHQD